MEALQFTGPFELEIKTVADPVPPTENEVLVQPKSTGVCGTDLGIVMGRYAAREGVLLGHETAGKVVSVGEQVRNFLPGDRIVINPTPACGCCRMCRSGRENHCETKIKTETGVTRDGTFAEFYKCSERWLHKLPDHVSYDEGALSEPASCALTGVGRLETWIGMRTVVFGGGPMGIVYAHALSKRGVAGRLVETSEDRRAILEDMLPAGWALAEDADRAIGEFDERQIDLAVDTTGALGAVGIDALSRGGQFLAVGLRSGRGVPVDMRRVADESLKIVGSIDSLGTFQSAVDWISEGGLPAAKIVSHSFELVRFREAFALLGVDLTRRKQSKPGAAMKVVLRP